MLFNTKKILFTLLLSAAYFNTQAQSVNGSYNYMSIQTGLNATETTSLISISKPNLNANFGVLAGHKFNSILFLETGITYQGKGIRFKDDNIFIIKAPANEPEPFETKSRHNFHYISVPLSAGIELGKKVKFRIKQSVNFDYLVGNDAALWINDVPIYPTTNGTQNLNDLYNRFGTSLTSSFGVKVPLGKYYLGSTIQSTVDLRSYKKQYTDQFITGALNFSVGYQF